MKRKLNPKTLFQVLKNAGKGFMEHKVFKLSASLAYYTVFSLGPLLIVIIFVASIFLGQEAVEGSIYRQLDSFVGAEAAKQMQDIVKNAAISDKGTIAAIIGIVTLLVAATTVFGELQDSLNTIWSLKAKPSAGIWKLVLDRLLSFGLIVSLGFILLVSLGVTAIIESIGGRLKASFPDASVVVMYIINLILTIGITTLLFAVIFKVLPDGKLKWKDVWAGAIATSVLFLIGKFAISFYIGQSDIGSTYGAAGSLVVILLWVYYSSVILYFGAEFTKAYTFKMGHEIKPSDFAVVASTVEVEGGKESVQQHERKKGSQASKAIPEATPPSTRRDRPAPAYSMAPIIYNEDPAELEREQLRKEAEEKKKGPGIGVVLGGLVLYFLRNNGEKR
jgi:membrane protein